MKEKGLVITMKGLLHIYCGDGKGKTTASLGLAMRAAGNGWRVVIAQFLKSWDTGELAMLDKLGIRVLRVEEKFGFTWQLTEEEKARLTAAHNALFKQAMDLCGDGEKTLLVLDELCAALSCGVIDRDMALDALRSRPDKLEVVVTGRDPAPELTAMADYITEMRKLRHPMDAGIAARRGIEF